MGDSKVETVIPPQDCDQEGQQHYDHDQQQDDHDQQRDDHDQQQDDHDQQRDDYDQQPDDHDQQRDYHDQQQDDHDQQHDGHDQQRDDHNQQQDDHDQQQDYHDPQQDQARGNPSLLSIEYDPSALYYTDPLCSMKADVYTTEVQDLKELLELEQQSEVVGSANPLRDLCDLLFKTIILAISKPSQSGILAISKPSQSGILAVSQPSQSGIQPHEPRIHNSFPYFDMFFAATNGALVPAHRIFLSRCPSILNLIQAIQRPSTVVKLPHPISVESLLIVLRLLYSVECEWLQESQFPSEEYTALEKLIGGGEKLRNLQDHLGTFVCSPVYSDARIMCGDSKMPVHKVIVCGRSEYFAKVFSPSFLSSRTGETELTDTSSAVIPALLNYLYTGSVEQATSLEIVVDMLALADRIRDNALYEACTQVVREHIHLDNCCALYCLSVQLPRGGLLWDCTRFIVDHYSTVVSLSDFSTLPEEARREMELMHEALTLNPVGRGSGFGCMREVIGALTEASMLMDERLKEAKESHQDAVQKHASAKEINYIASILQEQDVHVKNMKDFLTTLKSIYDKISNF